MLIKILKCFGNSYVDINDFEITKLINLGCNYYVLVFYLKCLS